MDSIALIENYFDNLSEEQREQFAKLGEVYAEWNSKINVISRKDMEHIYLHHILHSLAIAKVCQFESGAKVLDVGCGGGFPSVPLAILFPEVEFVACDSIGKKITVATEVAKGLGLTNVKTVNARAETLPETFDFIVSRAVTALGNFMPWVKGKYSEGILYLKGGDLAEEISEAMAQHKMRKGSVHLWPISSWTSDPFFETKYVIFIEK